MPSAAYAYDRKRLLISTGIASGSTYYGLEDEGETVSGNETGLP